MHRVGDQIGFPPELDHESGNNGAGGGGGIAAWQDGGQDSAEQSEPSRGHADIKAGSPWVQCPGRETAERQEEGERSGNIDCEESHRGPAPAEQRFMDHQHAAAEHKLPDEHALIMGEKNSRDQAIELEPAERLEAYSPKLQMPCRQGSKDISGRNVCRNHDGEKSDGEAEPGQCFWQDEIGSGLGRLRLC